MTMQFSLYSENTKIGEATFHASDPPMGCALFYVLPNEHYLALQPVLQAATMMRFDSNLSPEIETEIESLNLSIRDDADVILGSQVIYVDDVRAEMPEEPLQVWLLGMNRFEHYFPGEYERYEKSFR